MTGRILSLIIGYFIGTILTARIVARMAGINIDEEGSGNPGMANTGRVLGRGYAALVLAGDIIKTIVACLGCWYFFQADGRIIILYAGLGTALGHCYPVWSHFRGGKGVACLCTAIILFSPLYGTISGLVGLFLVLIHVGLKVSAAAISLCFSLYMLYIQNWEAFWVSLCMLVLMWVKNLAPNRLDKPRPEQV